MPGLNFLPKGKKKNIYIIIYIYIYITPTMIKDVKCLLEAYQGFLSNAITLDIQTASYFQTAVVCTCNLKQ